MLGTDIIDIDKLQAHLLTHRDQLETDDELLQNFCSNFSSEFLIKDDENILTKSVSKALTYDEPVEEAKVSEVKEVRQIEVVNEHIDEVRKLLGGKIDFSTKIQDVNDKNAEYFIQCQKHFGNSQCVF